MHKIKYWIKFNAIDISNGLLVIALFYFLILGITARVYIEYPFLFGGLGDFERALYIFINLMQVGVVLVVMSLVFNYLYEINKWLEKK